MNVPQDEKALRIVSLEEQLTLTGSEKDAEVSLLREELASQAAAAAAAVAEAEKADELRGEIAVLEQQLRDASELGAVTDSEVGQINS